MTLLEATPFLTKTGDRVWSLEKTGPIATIPMDQDETTRFNRLIDDYRLAMIYGIEPDSYEGLVLAARLAAIVAALPQSANPGYWIDLTERMGASHDLDRFFNEDDGELRLYIRETMIARQQQATGSYALV
jgi:hypothetical protein